MVREPITVAEPSEDVAIELGRTLALLDHLDYTHVLPTTKEATASDGIKM
jgi:hypothetical protein